MDENIGATEGAPDAPEAVETEQQLEEYDDSERQPATTETAPPPKKPAPKKVLEDGEEEKSAQEINDADLTEEQFASFAKTLNLPKGVEYFKNKKGEWRFIIPMDGKKYQASLEDVFRGFNLNQVGYKRLSQAKEQEKGFQDYLQKMREDPRLVWNLVDHVFKGTDKDKYALAQQLLQEAIAEAEMTPEQKARAKWEQEAEQIKRENENFKRKEQEQHFNAMVNEEREKLSKSFMDAMQKHGFKPFKPEDSPGEQRKRSSIMAHAIGLMSLANQQGRNLGPEDAIFIAKQEWQAYVQDGYQDLDEEKILELVPANVVEAIRKADRNRLTKGRIPTAGSGEIGRAMNLEEYEEEEEKPKKRKKQSIEDFFSSL